MHGHSIRFLACSIFVFLPFGATVGHFDSDVMFHPGHVRDPLFSCQPPAVLITTVGFRPLSFPKSPGGGVRDVVFASEACHAAGILVHGLYRC